MVENVLLVIACLCVLLLLLNPILNFFEDRIVHKDDGYGRVRQGIIDEMKRDGASYGDCMNHLFLREMMARFRREASDAVRVKPDKWQEEIDRVQDEIFRSISLENPDVLPAFGQMIKGLSYGHILYPTEAKMVDRIMMDKITFLRPTEDQRASLRIVRPG